MGRGLLIIVSGLFIVYGIIQQSVVDRKHSKTEENVTYAAKTQAKNIASAMAELSYQQLQKNGFKTGGTNDLGKMKEQDMMNGRGSAPKITERTVGNYEIKTIKGFGTFKSNGKEVKTTVTVKSKRRPFSKYSYFTDSESSGIYFSSDDVLNGPVHTNGTFKFNGDAIFNGDVTSGDIRKRGNNPIFRGKTNFNAGEIDLPVGGAGDEQIQKLVDKANNSKGLHYDNEIEVNFKGTGGSNSQGRVEISEHVGYKKICTGTLYKGNCYNGRFKYVAKFGNTKNYDLGDNSLNGIISSSKNVHVKGEVNGNVTLHSSKDVRIDGDVRYKDNPRNHDKGDPPSDDYLGIVSEQQTIVDKDAHKDHGNNNLDIDASIMALADNQSFRVEDYDDGRKRGELNIYGGLIQRSRGTVASLNGYGGISSGYAKNYTYDSRFLSHSPKGFPKTGIYDRYYWNSETDIKTIEN